MMDAQAPKTKPKGKHPDKRLTALFVRNQRSPGLYSDGQGLYLKVEPSGARRWVQRLIIHGKRRDIGLGSATLVALADARDAALANRKAARAGNDPLQAKRHAAKVPTFEEAARQAFTVFAPNWRNPKHAKQWIATMETYVFPKFGTKKADVVTSADLIEALIPIWNTKPVTARRVKQRISMVLEWAKGQSWRSDNPAEAIAKALPKLDPTTIKHQLALPYSEVPAALKAIQSSAALTSTKLATEFLILTATRSGEVRGAKWSEIDFNKMEWNIPAQRMKAKRAHRVPLSIRSIQILHKAKELRTTSGYIFPGNVQNKALSDMTLSKLMKELRIKAVPHGFRSSFRDWASEQTNFPREVCEFALAHVIKDKTEAAYARSDLFHKRRNLMCAWADYLSATKNKLVPLAAVA